MNLLLASLRSIAREGRRGSGFLMVAVASLGLGIGANVAVFSVVDAVLIRPLPYPEPERLVGIWGTAPGMKMDRIQCSDGTYVLFRKENRVLSEMGIYREGSATLAGGQTPERVGMAVVTGSLFSLLQVPPAVGRTIQEGDEAPGAEKVAVLADSLWHRRFGGDPAAVGSTLRVDGAERRIVGVMPAGFRFPSAEAEVWLPVTIDPARLRPTDFNYRAIGRLRPGVSAQRAARELSALIWRIPEVYGEEELSRGMIESARLGVAVTALRDDVVGTVERVLWVLLGSVGCILVIACANVANLFLVRAERRQLELALRSTFGATRGEVAGLFLGESLVLSAAGGLVGLGGAWAGVRLLASLRPPGLPRLEEIAVDSRAVLFALLVSLVAGLLCGGFAALRLGFTLAPALREGGRGGAAGRERHRARRGLVAAQVAVSLVLLVASGLMVKSFWRLRNVDPGFNPHGVLTLRLDLPSAVYRDNGATLRFVQQLVERVRTLPGVTAAGTIYPLPLAGDTASSGYWIEDFPLRPDQVWPQLETRFATPEAFAALGIPLLAGRIFKPLDPARPVADVVVSRALAERFWPGRSPLGKRLTVDLPGRGVWYTIVGVVGSVHDHSLEDKPAQSVYFPMVRRGERDWAPRSFHLSVRGRTDPRAFVAPIRAAARWGSTASSPMWSARGRGRSEYGWRWEPGATTSRAWWWPRGSGWPRSASPSGSPAPWPSRASWSRCSSA